MGAHEHDTMTSEIKRFAGHFTAVVENNEIRYVVPQTANGSETDVIKAGTYVKYYNYQYGAPPGEFEHDCEIGKLVGITKNGAGVYVCSVESICGRGGRCDTVYVHHIRPATARDIARVAFSVGHKVVPLDGSTGPSLVGAWSPEKAAAVGHVATIRAIEDDGTLRLAEFEQCAFSPEFVRRATETDYKPRFKVNAEVVCDAEHEVTDGLHWVADMTSLIGVVGKVQSVQINAKGRITYTFQMPGDRWQWHESWLRLADEHDVAEFTAGDEVVCDARPAASTEHPTWNDQMDASIGLVGKIAGIGSGYRSTRCYLVRFEDTDDSWCYRRTWLRALAPEEKAALVKVRAAIAALAATKIGVPIAAKMQSALGKRKAT